MIRKFVFSGLLFFCFNGILLFSQNAALTGSADDISAFEKRFKAIDQSMAYLKNKNIDSNDIITIYTDAESLFREVKYTSELKDYDMTIKFLSDKLSVLEEKSLDRVSLAKRMDLIYIIMVGMGLIIITLMSFYSIYTYSRRK